MVMLTVWLVLYEFIVVYHCVSVWRCMGVTDPFLTMHMTCYYSSLHCQNFMINSLFFWLHQSNISVMCKLYQGEFFSLNARSTSFIDWKGDKKACKIYFFGHNLFIVPNLALETPLHGPTHLTLLGTKTLEETPNLLSFDTILGTNLIIIGSILSKLVGWTVLELYQFG